MTIKYEHKEKGQHHLLNSPQLFFLRLCKMKYDLYQINVYFDVIFISIIRTIFYFHFIFIVFLICDFQHLPPASSFFQDYLSVMSRRVT